jgi:hypothetical protein
MAAVKRKLAWYALAMFIIVGVLWLVWPRDPISRETYQKIQMGMTLEETEVLVGRPSINMAEMMDILVKRHVRWITHPESVLHEGNDWSKSRPDLTKIMCWEGTGGGIAVQLGDDGRVIGKRYEERQSAGLVDRLRNVVGW